MRGSTRAEEWAVESSVESCHSSWKLEARVWKLEGIVGEGLVLEPCESRLRDRAQDETILKLPDDGTQQTYPSQVSQTDGRSVELRIAKARGSGKVEIC